MSTQYKIRCNRATLLLTSDDINNILCKKIWKYRVDFAHLAAVAISENINAAEITIDVHEHLFKSLAEVLVDPDNFDDDR